METVHGAPKDAEAKALIADCHLNEIQTIKAHRQAVSDYTLQVMALMAKAIRAEKPDGHRSFLLLEQVELESWTI